ncbi:MAG: ABC transporter permease [Sulfurifustaceae bacterium]
MMPQGPAPSAKGASRLPPLWAESAGEGESATVGAARPVVNDASFRRPSRGAQLVYMKDLLRELVVRDMKIRYEGTALGFAWMLAKPLLFVGVFFFVFQVVLALDTPRFTSFSFIGILVYTWFQSALGDASFVAFSNRELVRRPQFRVAVLPLVAVMTNMVHFLLSLPVLTVVLLLGGSEPSVALLALPLVVLIQFLLTAGLAYLTAAASVLFRDIGHLLNVVLTAFFFVCPIFYGADRVPAEFQAIYRLNPLVALLESYRNPLLHGLPPDWGSLMTVAAVAVLLAAVGYTVFERARHRFVEEL